MPAEAKHLPEESVPGIFDVEHFPPSGPDRVSPGARLLIEVPHGATTAAHFDALRGRLHGSYPDDLREFFFVNTDVGAPESAREIARSVSAGLTGGAPVPVCLLRCLIPRTFVDVNRVLDEAAPDYHATGLTPGMPEWVTDPSDRDVLRALYDAYQAVARTAFDAVCGRGGLALTLHTYAPRSVEIQTPGLGIAAALREAYLPENYDRWPRRPAVEIIDRTPQDECLASPALALAVERAYATIGIAVERNVTYRLDAKTTGHAHSARHPGRVLCVELNRGLLADPFDPFVEMRVSPAKASRMAGPLAGALATALASR